MTAQDTQPVSEQRLARLAWWLLVLLWAVQVYRPQMSFPANGLRSVLVAAGLLVLAAAFRLRSPAAHRGNVAAVAGALFVAFYAVRWLIQGMPASGSDNLGTLMVCASAAVTGYFLIGVVMGNCSDAAQAGAHLRYCIDGFLCLVVVVAVLCSVHAGCQYFWIYDQQYQGLLADIGAAEPTQLQAGLLHHLKLKRVASVWGDPNSLGGFLGLSLAASLTLALTSVRFGGRRLCRFVRAIGVAAIPLSLVGIALTRSRGGMLDAFLAVCAVLLLRRRRIVPVTAALVLGGALLLGAAADIGTTTPAGFWRSNTIRERLNYAQVGLRIIDMNLVFGSGPGAVDLYYGRYKSADARESKYLHNWMLQVAAETGVVGLTLCMALVLLLAFRALRSPYRSDPGFQSVMVIAGVLVADALFELSFNQREMMLLFGLCCGILLAGGGRTSSLDRFRIVRMSCTIIPAALLAGLMVFQLAPALLGSSCKEIARDAYETGDLDDARLQLRRAQGWTPRDPQLYLLLSQIEARTGSPDSAFLMLESAVRLNPQSASLRAQAAELALETGQLQRAEEAIRAALGLYPSKADYHFTLARILERRGDLPGAIRAATQAAELGYLYRDRYEAYLRQLKEKTR